MSLDPHLPDPTSAPPVDRFTAFLVTGVALLAILGILTLLATTQTGCGLLQDSGAVPEELKTVKVTFSSTATGGCIDTSYAEALNATLQSLLVPVDADGEPNYLAIVGHIASTLATLPDPECPLSVRTWVSWNGIPIADFTHEVG